MNHLDLFSGIGGFALGAEWAGIEFEHSFYSDIDNYANKVYAKNFPSAIALGDITKIDGKELKETYGEEWCITGGFPCQDISIAGKGAGLAGARSGLWFEMWRLISELRPRFVIAENVGALTFRGLDAVLASLAEIGYDAEWQDIRASDVGAPHRRERIWIIAYPECLGRDAWSESEHDDLRERTIRENIADNGDEIRSDAASFSGADVSDAKRGNAANAKYPRNRTSRSDDNGNNETRICNNSFSESRGHIEATSNSNSLRRIHRETEFDTTESELNALDNTTANDREEISSNTNGERLSRSGYEPEQQQVQSEIGVEFEGGTARHTESPGFTGGIERQGQGQYERASSGLSWGDEHWTTVATRLCGMDDVIPNRVDRLRCLGNSIVPLIAEILFRQILQTNLCP